ncbi:DUF4097 family beta strand repeat-containing protein [Anditalea andensis]|uniref:Adhesin domain-containing protein n=1 Tax=Anditalea andensis TaxID=1048983 RepID=A0A074KVA8_9BACT|nr:hypothetical protein [Anditalea andensis]KEO72869.1 hypothetical protein EL17_14680 [Anditalea andensis]
MLRRVCLIIWAIVAFNTNIIAQINKEFKVEKTEDFSQVKLNFSSYKGISHIGRDHSGLPIFIEASLAKVNILPSFQYSVRNNILSATLDHRNVESESLGKSITSRLFPSSNDDFDHDWKVGLNTNFLYDLNLNFGIGRADIDLSNINVTKCKIKTATADVVLKYSKSIPNPISMDTMSVSVNMGNVEANGLNFSNAKQMIFDVNYGNVNLIFSGDMSQATHVRASVGAGSVNITLPDTDTPYIVKVQSTAMCRTSIPHYLKSIGNKTYISKGYSAGAGNLMTIEIDVSVGSVALK